MTQPDFPPFFCPIAPAIHPDLAVIEKRSAAWLDLFKLYEDPARHALLLGIKAAEFYSRITPEAAAERIQPAVNWIHWAFSLDDNRCDRGPISAKTSSFVEMAARLSSVVDSRQEPATLSDPYEAALANIASDFRRYATATQLQRWLQAHRAWLFAEAWGVSMMETGAPSTLVGYLTCRLNSCGGGPTIAMIEIAYGHEVPAAEMDSPSVIALTEATRMVAALDNDLVSYRKERRLRESCDNVLSVISREHECSAAEAVFRAVAIRDRVMSLFLRLRARVLISASSELKLYIDGLGHTIKGNLDWSLAVPRYNSIPGAGPDVVAAIAPEWADRPSDDNPEPLPVPALAWWWEQLT